MAGPFVGFNVTASGASAVLVGYVQAIGTLASAVAQLVGGRLVDRTGKRVAMAGIFSVISGLLWVSASVYQEPAFLAVVFTAITLALGFYLAGFTAIVGEASGEKGRGAFLGSFAQLASVGALAALVLSTILTAFYPSFGALYLLSGAFFLISAFTLKGQREPRITRTEVSEVVRGRVKTYYAVTAFFGFFWGFAWPLFTITLVDIVKMDLFQYSLAQAIGAASTIGFQPIIARLVDRNRAGAVFWGRVGIVVYPVTYMFFGAVWQVYAINILSGVTNSLLNIAFVAYLYDISPAGHRGRYNAEFNLVTGVSTMAGSLICGYALTILRSPTNLWISLAYLYVVAAAGRMASAFLTIKLVKKPEEVGPVGTPQATGGKLV